MQQIIIAVQTPRAGKWNHRWIVPKGVLVDDVVLTNALSKFDSLTSGAIHKDGIVFFRSVEQTSSGRSAREFIFLYYPDFRDIVSGDGKRLCNITLNAFFESRMDQLVTSIDWDNTDGAMIYQCSEMVPLLNELKQAIQKNLEQTTDSEDKEKDKQKRRSGCVRFLTLMVTILAVLVYFGSGSIQKWFNQRPNQSQDISKNDAGNPKPVQPDNALVIGNIDTPSDEMSDDKYKEWQKLFTLPDDFHQRDKMVQAAIDTAYRYYYRRNPSVEDTNISKMSEDPNSFVNRLFDLRDVHESKVFYVNSTSPVVEFNYSNKEPNGSVAKELRKAINQLSHVNEAVKNMLKMCGEFTEDIEHELDNKPALINAKHKQWKVDGYPEVYPKFFFDSDKKIIENIRDYIKYVKSDSTIDTVLSQCSAKSHPGFEEYQTWIDFKNSFDKWFPDNE